uniref:Uncharacterized protein n=1 Tax=Setaria viridis TaxID=4556 RepID=A0A4U6VIH6_SETVI|nr:hypothetical protein SEVIR_3G334300v2 [Setaria viridis]
MAPKKASLSKPHPKYRKTTQMAPPNQAMAWKPRRNSQIGELVHLNPNSIFHIAIFLDEPSSSDGFQLPNLIKKITCLKSNGLTSVGVAFSFMRRRIQPLQLRCTMGYDYSGPNDPSRMTSEELSPDKEELNLYVSNPPPLGADVTPHMQSLEAMQRALEEEEEEKEGEREESLDWSSLSSSNSESAEKYVVKPHLFDKVGSSLEMSKHVAKDAPEVDVAPPPKKALSLGTGPSLRIRRSKQVPALELPEAKLDTESTSTMVTELVVMMLNLDAELELEAGVEPEAEVEVAAVGEVEAGRGAPEPETDMEAVGVLQVLLVVPPFKARLSTCRAVTTSLSSEAGPSTSRAMVPLGVPGAGEHNGVPPMVN